MLVFPRFLKGSWRPELDSFLGKQEMHVSVRSLKGFRAPEIASQVDVGRERLGHAVITAGDVQVEKAVVVEIGRVNMKQLGKQPFMASSPPTPLGGPWKVWVSKAVWWPDGSVEKEWRVWSKPALGLGNSPERSRKGSRREAGRGRETAQRATTRRR